MEMNFTSVISFAKTHNPGLIIETIRQISVRNIQQNNWSDLLKTIKGVKNKDSLNNCHSKDGA